MKLFLEMKLLNNAVAFNTYVRVSQATYIYMQDITNYHRMMYTGVQSVSGVSQCSDDVSRSGACA